MAGYIVPLGETSHVHNREAIDESSVNRLQNQTGDVRQPRLFGHRPIIPYVDFYLTKLKSRLYKETYIGC